MTTVGAALAAAGARLTMAGPLVTDTPRLDAEVLLGHVLGIERTRLLAYPEAPMSEGQETRFAALIERRASGEPVAYLRGIQEFHGLALAVDPRVLIPRPETELVVDAALDEIGRRLAGAPRARDAEPLHILDAGTGSGAIGIALAVALRRRGMAAEVAIIATEVSPDAVAVARENAVAHAVADRVGVLEADLCPPAGVPAGLLVAPARFDIVCANLPYIASPAVASLPVAVRFEPVGALDGGPDGLRVIRALLAMLDARTSIGASAFLEIGADQAAAIVAEAAALVPGWTCQVLPDLAGLPRLAALQRQA